tara:strand:+ start:1335 stop:2204 length:870 start_codon:yes stop_codon:yes gene_type:complete
MFRLAVATEDFEIPAERTDLMDVDDVPSAICKMMRLGRTDSVHREEDNGTPFRCWDVIGGLNNGVLRQAGDVIYVMFNRDSKRWEVLQSAAIRLIPAIVRSCLEGGWHEVELTDWDETYDGPTGLSGSSSASVSDDPCDPCALVDTDIGADPPAACESIEDVVVERSTGNPTGEIVYAHTTRLMPMMVGGLIKMLKRNVTSTGSSTSTSASGSISVSDDMIADRVYDVVDGVWPLIALPFPTYECCTDPVTGAQTVEMTQCTKAIVEGYSCVGEYIGCPIGSTSGSGSG